MGFRSFVIKSMVSAQSNAVETVKTMPVRTQKRLAALMGNDKHLAHADDLMKIFIYGNRILDLPFITQNPKKSRRLLLQRIKKTKGKLPASVKSSDKVIPIQTTDPLKTIKARLYQPKTITTENDGVTLYFHGGGFVVGSIETHDEFCHYLCEHSNLSVLSIDYRLAPEHPAPTAIEDAKTALLWAHEHIASFGCNPEKIYVAGDSAGGNIATVLCQQTQHDAITPKAQLLIYPITDSSKSYKSHFEYGKGLFTTLEDKSNYDYFYIHSSGLKPEDPLLSPIYGDISNIAPAYIATADLDYLVDEGEAYAYLLKKANITTFSERVYGLPHGFINMINVHPQCKLESIKLAQGFRAFIDAL